MEGHVLKAGWRLAGDMNMQHAPLSPCFSIPVLGAQPKQDRAGPLEAFQALPTDCALAPPCTPLQVLRLPPVRVKPMAPAYGMLSLTPDGAPAGLGASTPFWPLLEWVGQHCFSALLPLHQALVQLQAISASVQGQLLWCLASKTSEFEVSRKSQAENLTGAANLIHPIVGM